VRFFYAAYPGAEYNPEGEIEIYSENVTPTSVLHGPWLGMDQTTVYILWTMELRTGSRAGSIEAQYHSFPLGSPTAATNPEFLYVPSEYRIPYQPVEWAGLNTGPRVMLPGDYSVTSGVTQVDVNPGIENELAVAIFSQVEYMWRQVNGQVSTVYFKDGELTSYQLLSFSSVSSSAPGILSDDSHNLYVTWLQKSAQPGFQVYFTSTAPHIKSALNRLTGGDAGRLALETLFGMLIGALLSPLAGAIWILAPVAVILITAPIRRDNENQVISIGTVISLGAALAVYWMVKLGSLPDARTYVPFSAWIPIISDSLGMVLRILVPILIGAIAIAISWRFTFQRNLKSALYFLVIYTAVDALLSMAIYGVLFYGAF
jgi:hypothetical protein